MNEEAHFQPEKEISNIEGTFQPEVEEVMQNSELILREFIDSPIDYKDQVIAPWVPELHEKIKGRLDKNPPSRYLRSLSSAAIYMDEKKEKTLSAAIVYELQNYHSMEPVAYYTHKILFSIAISFPRVYGDSLLGKSTQKMLDGISLEEIYMKLQDKRKRFELNSKDIPNLSAIAVKRLYTGVEKDRQVAKEILNHALNVFFGNGYTFPHNISRRIVEVLSNDFELTSKIYLSSRRSIVNTINNSFSPEVIDYFLLEVRQKFPDIFNEILKTLNYRLSNIKIPDDKDEFERQYSEIESWKERGDFRSMYEKKMLAVKILGRFRVLEDGYYAFKENLQRAEEEKKQQEILNELRAEEERKQQEILNEFIAAEERIRQRILNQLSEEVNEKHAQRKRKMNNEEMDAFTERLSHLEVDEPALKNQILEKIQDIDILELPDFINNNWVESNWKAISPTPGTPVLIQMHSLKSLKLQVDICVLSTGDKEKKELLLSKWDKIKNKITEKIESIILYLLPEILAIINDKFKFIPEEKSINEFRDYLDKLSSIIDKIQTKITTEDSNVGKLYLEMLLEIITREQARMLNKEKEVQKLHEEEMKRVKEEEKQQSLDYLHENYLLDQIRQQTNYLSELYAIHTGIDFGDVECSTEEYMGGSVGTVSMGHGLSMRQEIRHSLRQNLELVENLISLEVGEGLESVKKRLAFINWVVPHEIAHIVDNSCNVLLQIFDEEQINTIASITDNWKGNHPDIAKEMLPRLMKEASIDGLGFRMIKEYGTVNIGETTLKERISSAAKAYLAVMSIFEEKDYYKKIASDSGSENWFSLVFLRQIAVGEIIFNEIKVLEGDSELLHDLEKCIEKAKDIFEEINQETGFVKESQKETIIDLFKKFFNKSKQVSLKAK